MAKKRSPIPNFTKQLKLLQRQEYLFAQEISSFVKKELTSNTNIFSWEINTATLVNDNDDKKSGYRCVITRIPITNKKSFNIYHINIFDGKISLGKKFGKKYLLRSWRGLNCFKRTFIKEISK